MNFFQSYIQKGVDKRINELIASDSFQLCDIDDREATKKIKKFILEQKLQGNTKLSTLDFVLSLNLPADQVESILDIFENQKKVRSVEYA